MANQIQHLEDLGDAKTALDMDAITKLRALLEGDSSASASQRGTLLTMIATMAAQQDMGQ